MSVFFIFIQKFITMKNSITTAAVANAATKNPIHPQYSYNYAGLDDFLTHIASPDSMVKLLAEHLNRYMEYVTDRGDHTPAGEVFLIKRLIIALIECQK